MWCYKRMEEMAEVVVLSRYFAPEFAAGGGPENVRLDKRPAYLDELDRKRKRATRVNKPSPLSDNAARKTAESKAAPVKRWFKTPIDLRSV